MSSKEPCLTTREAFDAMVYFLSDYFSRTKYEHIGLLLGELEIYDDERTTDPAAWFDWLKAVGARLEHPSS